MWIFILIWLNPQAIRKKQFGVQWIRICWNQGADPFEDGLEELARHQSFTEAFQDKGLDLEWLGYEMILSVAEMIED